MFSGVAESKFRMILNKISGNITPKSVLNCTF